MFILGIETSCDETAVAVLQFDKTQARLLSNNVSSQVKLHKKWGGVVPELAARRHVEVIMPLVQKSLDDAGLTFKKIEALAVTRGPGLITALQVGVETAKTLAMVNNKALVGVNHIAGHLVSPFLNNWSEVKPKNFPCVALVVSGGHTEIYLINKLGEQKLLGRTLDDAAGEAFDKVAKMLKLPYPGGPQVSRLAAIGNSKKFSFPSPMLNSKNFDFSFAGLKTAVLYTLNKIKKIDNKTKADICASFQLAAVRVLVHKTLAAADKFDAKTILLSGGVSANKSLRQELTNSVNSKLPNTKVLMSPLEFTGDNAAMIALAGAIQINKHGLNPYRNSWKKINANANWELW